MVDACLINTLVNKSHS